jgi:SepF-like predicted cell division protein (DUF552 family)
MFSFLKKIFYKEECYNRKTLIDKIKCVKSNLKITPYSKEYKGLQITFIHRNITEAISDLEELKSNIISDNIVIKKITEKSIKTLYINKWFTDNRMSILSNTDEIWYEYLNLNIWLIEWYNNNSKMGEKYYSYTLKIRPYILNITEVIDDIIKYQDKSI